MSRAPKVGFDVRPPRPGLKAWYNLKSECIFGVPIYELLILAVDRSRNFLQV